MFSTRFSLNALLLGMADVVLLLGALCLFGSGRTAEAVARGNICFCTLLFSLLCSLFEVSASRTLLCGSVFYAWGLLCMYFHEAYDPGFFVRLLLGGVGTAYVLWVLIRPWNPIQPDAEVDPTGFSVQKDLRR